MATKQKKTRWQGIIVLIILFLLMFKDKVMGMFQNDCACPENKEYTHPPEPGITSTVQAGDLVQIGVEEFEREEDVNLMDGQAINYEQLFNSTNDELIIKRSING